MEFVIPVPSPAQPPLIFFSEKKTNKKSQIDKAEDRDDNVEQGESDVEMFSLPG
jgi:hypothetical protein